MNIYQCFYFVQPLKKGLVGSQFPPQIREHFGGQLSNWENMCSPYLPNPPPTTTTKWRIWRTNWPNGEHPPEWRTLDTYGSYIA